MSNAKLLFCGDFAPNTSSNDFKPNDDFLSSVKEFINSHELAFLNIEAPFTDEINKIEKNGPNLKISKDFIEPLMLTGFNLFGLANNHIMDYGESGLDDTIKLLKSYNIDFTGAGENLNEASKIYYFEKNGIKVSIIAIAEKEFSIASLKEPGVAPLDMCHNYYQIKEAKENSDVLIVTMHAGNEHFPLPRPNLRKLCRLYIDLGVDLIINHHTHIPSAYEEYKNKKIYYGMGNFIFNLPGKSDSWNEGYMVSIDVHTENNGEFTLSSNIIPYKQSINLNGIEVLSGSKKLEFLDKLNEINSLLLSDALYEKNWLDFCESKRRQYFLATFFPFSFKGIGMLEKVFKISKFIMNKKTFTVKLNMLECDSHNEVLISLLRKGKTK